VGNIAYTIGKEIWSINPLWSVGVEEQFYAIWPFIINSKKVIRSISAFLLVFFLLKIYGRFGNQIFYTFLAYTRIDCMAIGGVFAYMNFTRSPLLKFLFSRILQILAWGLFIVSFMIPFHVSTFLDHELYSLIIAVIILNISYNPGTILSLENPVLNYIGKISFGIYAYHMLVFSIWNHSISPARLAGIPGLGYILPFILLGITLCVAHVSYFYFEKRFLALKEKYSIIDTTAAG
jgi:peptidoglycan/LPS O-acetylase OafA/YrhL